MKELIKVSKMMSYTTHTLILCSSQKIWTWQSRLTCLAMAEGLTAASAKVSLIGCSRRFHMIVLAGSWLLIRITLHLSKKILATIMSRSIRESLKRINRKSQPNGYWWLARKRGSYLPSWIDTKRNSIRSLRKQLIEIDSCRLVKIMLSSRNKEQKIKLQVLNQY
jgi:hypothetical protein